MTQDRRRALVIGPADADVTRALAAAGLELSDDRADGRPDVVVVTGDDVPLVIAALDGESAVRVAQARAAELDAFAGRASHDLKTPLAVMAGTAQTLLRAWDRLAESDRTALLEAMAGQATKAAAMVNDLLELARTDPRLRIGPRVDDVRSVVDDAIGRLPLAPTDELSIGEDLPAIAVPRADLLSIVSNLVDNAHHYGRSADGVLRLAVATTSVGSSVRLTVDDAGPGVPADAVAVLFRPDGRLEGSADRNPNSTGMGLAIVKRCAERAGGAVGVEPSPSGGARFWATLPGI